MPDSLWQAVQQETDKQTGKRTAERTSQSTELPRRKRTSQRQVRTAPPRPERPKERRTERRPYDFYQDQVLSLKEIKLEIEKRYGRRVTANAMVQLALDLLIEDYRKNRDRSKLVLKLVADERTFFRTSGGRD